MKYLISSHIKSVLSIDLKLFMSQPLMKMGVKTLIVFVLCSVLINYVEAQFTTTVTAMNITSKVVINATPGSSGDFLAVAPVDQLIAATCTLTFQGTKCNDQMLFISTSGNKSWGGSDFCKTATFTVTSIGNKMFISYILKNPGKISCEIKAVQQANVNCDCGWSAPNKKIVGGTETKVNEFTSHAGLVDIDSRAVICGAVISESDNHFSLS